MGPQQICEAESRREKVQKRVDDFIRFIKQKALLKTLPTFEEIQKLSWYELKCELARIRNAVDSCDYEM